MWRLSPKQREFCFCIFCIEPMSIFLPCYRPAKTNSFLQNGTKYLLIWLFADRALTHLKKVILITSLTLAPLVRMAGSPFSSACYLSATGMISQSKLFPERRAPTTELISPIIVDPRGCERPSQSSRPMREQRLRKATNGRPEASGDAPAELAAHISHHFERFPGCRLLTVEQESSLGASVVNHQRLKSSFSMHPRPLFQRTFLAFKRFPN